MGDFLTAIRDRLGELFAPSLVANSVTSWTENVLVAMLTFLVYYALWRVVRLILTPVLKRLEIDATGRSFFHTAARVLILTLGVVASLGELGVNTASLTASLGVAGLTLGFAARDALSNIISGIFIFWDRPFVLGDLIEVGGQYGQVDRITLRSTRVVTVEGKMLAIPNAAVVNSTVASYTNFPHLRIDVPVTVGLGEDLGRVRSLLLDAVEKDAQFLRSPRPAVVVSALDDFNVQVTLQAWLDDERQHISKRFELRERAFESLRRAGIDMPYETLRVLGPTASPAAVAS